VSINVKDNQQRELSLESLKPAVPAGPYRILRLAQVRALTGLCRSSIYQLQAQKRFPLRVKIGARAVGWVEGDVQKWLAEKVARSRAEDGMADRS
jgi:prophage regulatory protein